MPARRISLIRRVLSQLLQNRLPRDEDRESKEKVAPASKKMANA